MEISVNKHGIWGHLNKALAINSASFVDLLLVRQYLVFQDINFLNN